MSLINLPYIYIYIYIYTYTVLSCQFWFCLINTISVFKKTFLVEAGFIKKQHFCDPLPNSVELDTGSDQNLIVAQNLVICVDHNLRIVVFQNQVVVAGQNLFRIWRWKLGKISYWKYLVADLLFEPGTY